MTYQLEVADQHNKDTKNVMLYLRYGEIKLFRQYGARKKDGCDAQHGKTSQNVFHITIGGEKFVLYVVKIS